MSVSDRGVPEVVVARPRVVTANAIAWSIVLPGAALLGWFALAPDIRALFTAFQIATLIFFLLFMLGFVWVIALSYVRADAAGLRFRNGLRTHRVGWDEVLGIRYAPGDAWAFVQLDGSGGRGDVDRLPLMGIMRTDKQRADRLVADLRSLQAAAQGRPA